MNGTHVGDWAELYALGALDDVERARVDAHLRACDECRQRVGAAERDVALVASMQARHEPPAGLSRRIEALVSARAPAARRERAPWRASFALAAGFAVTLLSSLYLWDVNRALHRWMLAQNAAMERIAAAPHAQAAFRPMPGGPAAQVMYGKDGSWYLIVVHEPRKVLSVAWMHDGQRTMLGDAIPNGELAMLYLPKSHRMDRLALMDGDKIVAQATLAWGKSSPARPAVRSG